MKLNRVKYRIGILEQKLDQVLHYVEMDNNAAERHIQQMVDKYGNTLGLANRLEHMKEKVKELSEKNDFYSIGLQQVQQMLEIILMQIAMEYGGDDHKITFKKHDLEGWKYRFTEENGEINLWLVEDEQKMFGKN